MQLVDQIRRTVSCDHIDPCIILLGVTLNKLNISSLQKWCGQDASRWNNWQFSSRKPFKWSVQHILRERCPHGQCSRCIKEMKGMDPFSASGCMPDVLCDLYRWAMHKKKIHFNNVNYLCLDKWLLKPVCFSLWELHLLECKQSVWKLYQIKKRAAAVNEGPPALALNMMPIYQRPLTLPATRSGHRKYGIPGRWELKLKLQKPSLCKWLGAAVSLHISEHLNSAICHIFTGLHVQRVKKVSCPG